MNNAVSRYSQARKLIDQCSQGEDEVRAALDHLRAAASLYEQGGRQSFAANIRTAVNALRKEAVE